MSIKNPILLDFPMPLETARLTLRPLMQGDGKAIFEAIEESRDNLSKWLAWPPYVKKWEDSEKFARESYGNFILRKSLNLGIFHENKFIGTCGFNYFLWNIPSAEIGYWCRTSAQGNGYMTGAGQALTHYGFDTLTLKRIVITCIDENHASAKIAEKLGFELEVRAQGLLENPHGDDLIMGRRYVRFNDNNSKF